MLNSYIENAEAIGRNGFLIIDEGLDAGQVERVVSGVEKAARGRDMAGIRQPHVLIPEVEEVTKSIAVRELVEGVLGREARVVRSVLFDKTQEKNWGVSWHQDLTIAVAERREVAGFVGWSVKDGVNHVQAPREVLERMLTVRLHLDDCEAENGPLRVLPGTHRTRYMVETLNGYMDTEAIERAKREVREEVCLVKRGGAVLMRPLLLHASSRAMKPGHRRVLHLEFAAGELPGGLQFFGS